MADWKLTALRAVFGLGVLIVAFVALTLVVALLWACGLMWKDLFG